MNVFNQPQQYGLITSVFFFSSFLILKFQIWAWSKLTIISEIINSILKVKEARGKASMQGKIRI